MTLLHTIYSDGTYKSEEWEGALEYAAPPFRALKGRLEVADPIHARCDIEHVNVWWHGKLAHMFVDEMGRYKPVRRNNRATRIYYNMTLKREHRDELLYDDIAQDPKSLPIGIEQPGFLIVGVALLWEGDME
jgi:hypothetical protein